MPITPPPRGADLLPDVPGLWARGDGSLQALLLSHAHPDHHGLADLVDERVPVFLGRRAAAILEESSFFIPWAPRVRVDGALEHRRPLELGAFTVTPWLVDHSADDAYALLVEAGGRRVLYSGDWRGHGDRRGTIEELISSVGGIDTLMIEGTRIDRNEEVESGSLQSETGVEKECAELFSRAPSAVLTFCSGQNLARLDRLYAACRRTGRSMVLDLYAATIWEASGRPPVREAAGTIRVHVPRWQRRRIIEAE